MIRKLFIGVALLASTYTLAQNPNPSIDLDDDILDEMHLEKFPGVSTIIVKNGEIVWIESYGLANKD